MFPKAGGHNHVRDYNSRKSQMPSNELSIHTWMDADLRELAELVKQTQTVARQKDATMEFALVFPDKRGQNVMRVVRASTRNLSCDCRSCHVSVIICRQVSLRAMNTGGHSALKSVWPR